MRVRQLFAQARKEAPAIVFIDEIDAVAKGDTTSIDFPIYEHHPCVLQSHICPALHSCTVQQHAHTNAHNYGSRSKCGSRSFRACPGIMLDSGLISTERWYSQMTQVAQRDRRTKEQTVQTNRQYTQYMCLTGSCTTVPLVLGKTDYEFSGLCSHPPPPNPPFIFSPSKLANAFWLIFLQAGTPGCGVWAMMKGSRP